LRIFARCNHLRDTIALSRAGANVIASGEAEVGVALAEAVLANEKLDYRTAAERREDIRCELYNSLAQ